MTSLVEIYRRFPDRAAALAHLEKVRWPEGPRCVFCGAATVARKAEASQMDRLQCWSCRKSFSATAGTIFHNSHVDLQRWFLLIALMLNAKKGLSAMQAARDLDMRRPTVWSMMHRVRAALADDGPLLAGFVVHVARRGDPADKRDQERGGHETAPGHQAKGTSTRLATARPRDGLPLLGGAERAQPWSIAN